MGSCYISLKRTLLTANAMHALRICHHIIQLFYSIIYYSIGLLIGNLIFGILILFFDQFRRVEFPMFGTDYQTFPQPLFVISNLTILWLSIMIIVLLLWSILNFIFHSHRSLKSKEFLDVAINY